ncbi:MAG: hypothetical protein Q4Q07_04560 [Tissierellia bacterium]|nr:hypothetical protein [Tissierellia bacterium]
MDILQYAILVRFDLGISFTVERNTMITYADVVALDIKSMKAILAEFVEGEKAWAIFCDHYKDPDGYPIDDSGFKSRAGIDCSVDAILSINRIYEHEGFNENFINTFRFSRERPIIFFPKERGGINQSRYRVFGDRIDHTLFDLKRYFEKKDCKLRAAYTLPKTRKWLQSFDDFPALVKWLHIEGIFVDDGYNVFDLSHNDGTCIEDYSIHYARMWSSAYYEHVVERIAMYRRGQ